MAFVLVLVNGVGAAMALVLVGVQRADRPTALEWLLVLALVLVLVMPQTTRFHAGW